jgi:hypothetical protein
MALKVPQKDDAYVTLISTAKSDLAGANNVAQLKTVLTSVIDALSGLQKEGKKEKKDKKPKK